MQHCIALVTLFLLLWVGNGQTPSRDLILNNVTIVLTNSDIDAGTLGYVCENTAYKTELTLFDPATLVCSSPLFSYYQSSDGSLFNVVLQQANEVYLPSAFKNFGVFYLRRGSQDYLVSVKSGNTAIYMDATENRHTHRTEMVPNLEYNFLYWAFWQTSISAVLFNDTATTMWAFRTSTSDTPASWYSLVKRI